MADNEQDEAQSPDLSAILADTLSEEELQEFKDILDSESFHVMVRAYHAQAALETIRFVVLGLIEKENLPVEVMLTALVGMWLELTAKLSGKLNSAKLQEIWSNHPTGLCQLLLQHAVDIMQQAEDELDMSVAPELEEMYADWNSRLPGLLAEENLPENWQKWASLTQTALRNFHNELQSTSGLQIEDIDYYDAWTHMLLQFYLFTYFPQAEFYYLLSTNWHLFAAQHDQLFTLFLMLRGYEELLLPENRDKLLDLMQDPKIMEILAERQELG